MLCNDIENVFRGFLVPCSDIENVFREEPAPRRAKKQQSIGIKSFHSNTGFECKKNCISKLTIKMFTTRKTRAGKAYVYQMLLSFKRSVTYKKNFNFTPDNCVYCEAAFVGHSSIFCRTLSNVRYLYSGLSPIRHLPVQS